MHWLPAREGRWGSAIFARSGRLRPIALPIHHGYGAGAEIIGSEWQRRTSKPIRVFSLPVTAPTSRKKRVA